MSTAIRNISARRLLDKADKLGESPIWDAENATLYWVDSVSRVIHIYDTIEESFAEIEAPSIIGSIGLGKSRTLVAGLVDGIYLVDLDRGAFSPLYCPTPQDPRIRFNDGKVDRQGRYVCGTMGVFAEPRGELFRIDHSGQAEVLANGLRISNSLCFSPDGGTMYFSDTLDRKIRAYAYDQVTGTLSHPRIHVDTSRFESGPDGSTIDSAGFLWVALVQAGKIGRFTPDGELERLVEAPTDMPSCVNFGGPDMATLYVTSIKDSGTGRAVSNHAFGGYIYALDGLGVTGLPEPRFGKQDTD